jgi:hypothetical protein
MCCRVVVSMLGFSCGYVSLDHGIWLVCGKREFERQLEVLRTARVAAFVVKLVKQIVCVYAILLAAVQHISVVKRKNNVQSMSTSRSFGSCEPSNPAHICAGHTSCGFHTRLALVLI